MSRLIHIALLCAVLLSVTQPLPASAQISTPSPEQVARILGNLSPAERVGQLFIVTFTGRSTDDDSAIYELITQYHVGGVALLASNDNFTDTDTFAESTLALTTALQSLAAQPGAGAGTPTPFPGADQYIPLFIAAPYIEDSSLGLSLLRGPSGLSQLPSAMTLGATWDPASAEIVGQITGAEFAALGINMLFGPTLDVIESPQPASSADLGARAFGGDPYWVGRMGEAFIRGLHTGSQNRMVVVAQHFPGYGASDRALEEQIPTVSKTLGELRAIDLAPFFTVTRPGATGLADALLVSHVRYRGLQENIRDTTRPISLDPSALSLLLGLPELAVWRANGGVTVSDALGVRALRRFYDPTERTFQAFNIARDAFLAGNDVLYLGQFATPGSNETEVVRNVLRQFLQKYNEDPAFAQSVDQAVARIIALKLKLYGTFTPRQTTPTIPLEVLGQGEVNVLAATREAATLISPTSAAELANRLPTRPSGNQRIVFITDSRTARQCTTCNVRPLLATDALQQAVLRLYGPQGTNETFASLLSSYSFAELTLFLDNVPPPATPTPEPTLEFTSTPDGEPTLTPTAAPPAIDAAIAAADWVVFSMLDVKSTAADSMALKRLLAERPDLLQNKRVIVFAFDAPYYLDATEVAQLTAYFGLYNRSAAAVQIAARILFQEITPSGASPVSIDAIGYKLIDATQPDPDQVISLSYELSSGAAATPTAPTTPGAEPTPAAAPVALNDVINLRTNVIVDRNGNPVPDGTPVRFWVNYIGEGLKVQLAEVTTLDGVAVAPFRLDREGQLEISVTSEPAIRELFKLQFDVRSTGLSTVIAITSTPGATATAEPTTEPTNSPAPDFTATPTPAPVPPQPPVTGADLFMTILTLAVLGAAAWRVTNSRVEAVSDGVKLFLLIAIGALLAYNYYALRLPGSETVRGLGIWAVPAMVWLGGGLGFGAGWWLLRGRTKRAALSARHEGDEDSQ